MRKYIYIILHSMNQLLHILFVFRKSLDRHMVPGTYCDIYGRLDAFTVIAVRLCHVVSAA